MKLLPLPLPGQAEPSVISQVRPTNCNHAWRGRIDRSDDHSFTYYPFPAPLSSFLKCTTDFTYYRFLFRMLLLLSSILNVPDYLVFQFHPVSTALTCVCVRAHQSLSFKNSSEDAQKHVSSSVQAHNWIKSVHYKFQTEDATQVHRQQN